MKTRINLNIQGEVEILINDNTIYKKHNAISPDALQIIMMSLSTVPFNVSVDKIVVKGEGFDDEEIAIINAIYDEVEGAITFVGKIATSEAVGKITDLELRSSMLTKNLAVRDGLEIVKNSTIEIEVRWKILITNC